MSWRINRIVFVGKKTYGEFRKLEEGIATNVLASRLAFLEEQGILSRALSPEDGRKDFYTLTSIELSLPFVYQAGSHWDLRSRLISRT